MASHNHLNEHKTFFTALQAEFEFLTQHYNFEVMAGFAILRKGRVVIYPPSPSHSDPILDKCDDLIIRYERPNTTIELLYSLSNRRIECFITYDNMHRFSLIDMMYVLHPHSSLISHELTLKQAITTHDDLIHAAHAIKAILHPNIDLYLSSSNAVVDMAYTQQEDLLKQKIQSAIGQGIESAVKQAEAELNKGDYKAAITLLRPYKDHLAPKEFQILSLALMRLDE